MESESLFKDFLQRIEYPDPVDTTAGTTHILNFDSHQVHFSLEHDAIRIWSFFGSVPQGDVEKRTYLEQLLKRSLAWAGPECVALDPDSHSLILTRRIHTPGEEPAQFELKVEAFLNRLDMWAQHELVLHTPKSSHPAEILIR